MNKKELQEARTNPNFLKYLEETKNSAIQSKDISAMYDVLDSYLILDIEKDKVNTIYQKILELSQEEIDKKMSQNKKLTLQDNELFYIRALYEFCIEKWSCDDFKGAQELLFILTQIVHDKIFVTSMNIHLIICSLKISLDNFHKKYVNLTLTNKNESYEYFTMHYKIDSAEFLKKNKNVLDNTYKNLKYLMD